MSVLEQQKKREARRQLAAVPPVPVGDPSYAAQNKAGAARGIANMPQGTPEQRAKFAESREGARAHVAEYDGELVSQQGRADLRVWDEEMLGKYQVQDPEEAADMYEMLSTEGANLEIEDADKMREQLDDFERRFPGVLTTFNKERAVNSWAEQMIESDPMPSSFEAKQRRAITASGPSGEMRRWLLPDVHPEDMPSDSWDAVVHQAEKQGIDTQSGLYDNIFQVADAAMHFDSPQVRSAVMHVAVQAKLEEAGIAVPEGVPVITVHEDLGVPMYLNPQENGKLRWTLISPEVLSAKDIGRMADPSDLLSIVGATGGALATGGNIAGEMAGDYVGRSVGNALELWWSRGLLGENDYMRAFGLGALESAGETVAGRVVGRAFKYGKEKLSGTTTVVGDTADDIERIQREVDETADMMEALQEITGRSLRVTTAEATKSRSALREQKARTANASDSAREKLAQAQDQNAEVLSEAVENTMGPRRPITERTYEAVKQVDPAAKAADQEALPDVMKGQPIRRHTEYDPDNPDLEMVVYRWAHDTSGTEGGKELSERFGDGFNLGVRMGVDRKAKRIYLFDAFEGASSKGLTLPLLDAAWKEADKIGYDIYGPPSMTVQSRNLLKRMEERGLGWTFEWHPDAQVNKNGLLRVPTANGELPTEPVFRVVGRPGDPGDLAAPWREDGFDKLVWDAKLADYESAVPAAQAWVNETTDTFLSRIEYDPQTSLSKYYVANPDNSPLNREVKALINRRNETLTGIEEAGANRALSVALKKVKDEEGGDVLVGLIDQKLDYGALVRARDALGQAAQDTNDPSLIAIVGHIDDLLKNGKMFTRKGNAIADSTRGRINFDYDQMIKAQDMVHEATSAVQASRIFAKNADGDYLITTQDMGRLLKGKNFLSQLAPVVRSSPDLQAESVKALRQIYAETVAKPGVPWSRAKHDDFIRNYGPAIDELFGPDEAKILKQYDLSNKARDVWDSTIDRLNARARRARAQVASNVEEYRKAISSAPEAGPFVPVNDRAVLQSLNKQPWVKSQGYIYHVRSTDPARYAALQDLAAEQIQHTLQTKFFNGDQLSRGAYHQMRKWLGENQEVIKLLMPEDYWKNLNTIASGFNVASLASSVKAPTERIWDMPVRWMRTIFGVLTRPQRQLTAAQWTKARMNGRAATKLLANPEAVRAITVQNKKGLPVTDQAFVSTLLRFGFFSEMGIVGDPGDPEVVAKATAYLEDMNDLFVLGEDENVE